jgi:MFS family permease
LALRRYAAANHSRVLSIGAFFALASNPFFGRLSDRTTSRFGMRRPWLIGGVIGGAAALSIVARADTIQVPRDAELVLSRKKLPPLSSCKLSTDLHVCCSSLDEN